MTTFNLSIEMDSDAFAQYGGAEVQRILAKASEQVQYGAGEGDTGTLRDSNGNTVGTWEIVDDYPPTPVPREESDEDAERREAKYLRTQA